ncbi:phenylacetic acid degradation bifunctional protein PaaZ [Thalassococcus sp. CAU 1522]|uniref:Phenylacetic acid degradation bifunctional protein PaaZ n=1 Tax=Thalassococcus arenae TaxID=2851652 RepID=A0ABS6N4L8_9RHOB|nr:phenylacetic acid degradation bifunctional protein PaaZ [Thalassococcus arenae]MBV2358539.1 phenylacetic acid degradation bifunctional protein PaaZ [Thalassococcus arenae]
MQDVQSFVCGRWVGPGAGARPIASAVTGAVIAQAGNDALDVAGMLDFARSRGGAALRAMTFHQRAKMLKALAQHLNAHKDALYQASFDTGATARDHLFDVDGGIGTLFVYASKGRRELPDAHVLRDGPAEQLGKTGTFLGQHVYTPKRGVAVHINAFNFPVWGMLEKLAPCLLAGVPSVVKPATATCYVTELCVRLMIDSGHLPDGALQLVTGGLGDTLDLLDCQDSVTFTGSEATALKLRTDPGLIRRGVSFTAEQDSLNATILGPDVAPGSAEFDLFVKEVLREMTVKAGQKCTAIRRIIVPQPQVQAVLQAVSAGLAKVTVGDPRREDVRMGALVSAEQRADVLAKAAAIGAEAERVFAGPAAPLGDGVENGAFVAPMLFLCADPDAARAVHETEAFGPVATILPCRDAGHAIALANRGRGSLVASVVTRDPAFARDVVLGAGAWHGRLYFNNADSAAEATGHGAPMPHMVHGGPGRAGGGEELGGIRAVRHFMQRSAVQGSPDLLSAIGEAWQPGGTPVPVPAHPFTRRFGALHLGETLQTPAREITLADIEHFAEFTGDTFYAHMDEDAAARNPFFPGRVAHGYLLLSFAAGLFVEPNEGPVLANTGLDNLRFMKPVVPGDSIAVTLTVKQKTPRNDAYGEVRWHVRLANQDDETVAEYELLTMVAC